MDIKANVNLFNRPEGNLKALASISLDDDFIVKGIRVVQGEKGLFISMPSQKVGSEYRDVCFPKSAELREQINRAVLEAYEQTQTQKQEQKSEESIENDKKQTKKGTQKSKHNGIEESEPQQAQEEQTDDSPVMSM